MPVSLEVVCEAAVLQTRSQYLTGLDQQPHLSGGRPKFLGDHGRRELIVLPGVVQYGELRQQFVNQRSRLCDPPLIMEIGAVVFTRLG